ncbi:hypothetical protein Bca52824_071584 [Brassica carinata]|uniref:Uncharacterized protein n=1 Tax=Brassica carinata TaxID=52824 RepID=A0A8X7Q9D8_BRACI|nr:hypothetical protein Bca52824_071584 [Brassica carinata]
MIHGFCYKTQPERRVQEVRAGRPTTTKHIRQLKCSEDLAGVDLVVDLTDFGEEAVIHVEDEPVIGEFHQDRFRFIGDDDSKQTSIDFF